MSAPEPLAVVGPEGALVLPTELRRRHGLEPGVTLHVVERPDGVLELHRAGAVPMRTVPPDFWERWFEAARSPDGEVDSHQGLTPPS